MIQPSPLADRETPLTSLRSVQFRRRWMEGFEDCFRHVHCTGVRGVGDGVGCGCGGARARLVEGGEDRQGCTYFPGLTLGTFTTSMTVLGMGPARWQGILGQHGQPIHLTRPSVTQVTSRLVLGGGLQAMVREVNAAANISHGARRNAFPHKPVCLPPQTRVSAPTNPCVCPHAAKPTL